MKSNFTKKIGIVAAGILSLCAVAPSHGEGLVSNGGCLTGDFFGKTRFANKGFSFVDGSFLQQLRSRSNSGSAVEFGDASARSVQFFEYSAKGRTLTLAIRGCLADLKVTSHSFSNVTSIVASAPAAFGGDENESMNFEDVQPPQGLAAGPAISPVPEPGNILVGVMVLGVFATGGLKGRFFRGARREAGSGAA